MLFPLHPHYLSVLDNATVGALHKELCVANRGLMLIDAPQWRASLLTRTIESLVKEYVASKGRLWRSGVSQPPLQLALAGRYHRLDVRWNVRGLGRHDMSDREWLAIRDVASAASAAEVFFGRGAVKQPPWVTGRVPYLAPNAHRARLLHFNGRLKPWCTTIAPVGGALCAVNASHYRPCHALWWEAADWLLEDHALERLAKAAPATDAAVLRPAWPMTLPTTFVAAVHTVANESNC